MANKKIPPYHTDSAVYWKDGVKYGQLTIGFVLSYMNRSNVLRQDLHKSVFEAIEELLELHCPDVQIEHQ